MSERLIILDVGDLKTRALAIEGPGAATLVELESAAAPVHVRDFETADASQPSDEVPQIVGLGDPGGFVEVGAPAADRAGYDALVAARPTAEKIEALARAALFSLARGGDRVRLVLVASPGETADRLEEVAFALEGTRPLAAIAAPGAPLETRRLTIEPETLAAGTALLERAFAIGAVEDGGAPALALDLGHRATRLYLIDPAAGAVDVDVIPHGGESLLEHARRFAREKGAEPRDLAILRELAAGAEMLSVGGLAYPVRRFFELPRDDLAKAIAGAAAERLRRQLERGGRWPGTLLLAGGLAGACAGALSARLAERGLALARQIVLAPEPPPLLAGAIAAARSCPPLARAAPRA